MTEAIVHVGVHKTGTSSIQRVMANNRPRLREQGFLYPSFSPNHFDIYSAFSTAPLKYHMIRGRGIKTLEEVDALRDRVLGSIRDEMAASGLRRLLLVAEDISSMAREELARFRAWMESIGITRMTMFIYVRDHVSFWESQLQQHVKGGTVLDIPGESQRLTLVRTYRTHIRALAEVFGAENVRVNVFGSKHLKDGDVIVDFADKIGLDVAGMEMLRANESLSRDAMLFLNEMNRRIPTFADHGRTLLREGLLGALRRHKGPKLKADLLTARRIREKSAADRAYLAETWFAGADPLGRIIDDSIARLEAEGVDAAETGALDTTAMLDVAAHLYRELKLENMKVSSDRFRLKGIMKRDEGDEKRSKEFFDKWRRLKRETKAAEKQDAEAE